MTKVEYRRKKKKMIGHNNPPPDQVIPHRRPWKEHPDYHKIIEDSVQLMAVLRKFKSVRIVRDQNPRAVLAGISRSGLNEFARLVRRLAPKTTIIDEHVRAPNGWQQDNDAFYDVITTKRRR